MKRKAADKMDLLLTRLDQLIALLASRAAYAATTGPPVLRQQVAAATQQYMSGRWHRRSGDVYGIVSEPQSYIDANCPPGHIRPPDQR